VKIYRQLIQQKCCEGLSQQTDKPTTHVKETNTKLT